MAKKCWCGCWWSPDVVILVCVLCCSCVGLDSAAQSLPLLSDNNAHLPSIVTGPNVDLDPTIEYFGPHGTATLWQIPPGLVKRVLFIAIGSGTLPWDYWDRTPGCPLCRGLPEMRKIVVDALSRRYAVILISPIDFGHSWEAWPQDSADLVNARLTLSMWKRAHGLVNTPTVALGPSAGGHALSTLGLHGTGLFQSMVLMVSKGVKEAWHHVREGYYPPTLFVHCPRDAKTMEAILAIVADLREKGVQAKDVPWNPHPITPTWFSELIPGVDADTSKAIYGALKREGSILDEHDYLLEDNGHWELVLRKRKVLPEDPELPGQVLYKAALSQEVRVAYALHVTLARRNHEIFRWFEGDYGGDGEGSSTFIPAGDRVSFQ